MQLLLRRTQHPAFFGPPTFTLDVRAEITDADRMNIARYHLGKTLLFSRKQFVEHESWWARLLYAVFFRATNLTITVDDLADGKRIQCKDILEMLAMEKAVRKATQTFGLVLRAATYFGGEEVLPL